MWADQVSATEDPAISLAAGNTDKATPLDDGETDGRFTEEQHPKDSLVVPSDEPHLVATPDQLSVLDLPPTEPVSQNDGTVVPSSEAVTFPSSVPYDVSDERNDETKAVTEVPSQLDTSSPPLAFPSSEPELEGQGSNIKPAPAVTFGADVNPSRTGTPDPDSEPKRKRISSQNFQRLARRISITAKRQSSSMIPTIPGLKRDSSPRVSVDEGSARDTDSATGSVKGDDKGKKKKDKKDKSRKSTL